MVALRTKAPVIRCTWCGEVVRPNGPRMRMFESEGIAVSGKWLAHFHPECGDAALDYCADRLAEKHEHVEAAASCAPHSNPD